MKKRKIYPKEFKARVALEALQGEKTIAQLSSEYEINGNLVIKWKKSTQCEWLGLNRSNLYYIPRERNVEFEDQLRKEIDLRFMKEACGILR